MTTRARNQATASSRNLRYYIIGLAVSSGGMWMRTMALSWLVLERSHDNAIAVGFLVAVQYLPTTLLGSWAGVIIDRADKRKVLGAGQVVGALTAAALALVTATSAQHLWLIYVIVAVGGLTYAIDLPARQAFLGEIVDADELHRAIGLVSATQQATRVIGPLVAGAVIVTLGTAMCFVVNAASCVAPIIALWRMEKWALRPSDPLPRADGQIREGFRYIWRTPALRGGCLAIVVVGLAACNNQVLLPIAVRVTFDGDETMFSWMLTGQGIGALIGSLFIARRRSVSGGELISWGVAFGSAMCAAALAPTAQVFFVLMVVCALSQTGMLAVSQVLLQLSSDPSMRGRVMALWFFGVIGTTPLSGPLVGWMASMSSPRWVYGFGGAISILTFFSVSTMVVNAERLSKRPSRGEP